MVCLHLFAALALGVHAAASLSSKLDLTGPRQLRRRAVDGQSRTEITPSPSKTQGSNAGGTHSPPDSPTWTLHDVLSRQFDDVLAQAHDPTTQRQDQERFRRDPLAYDLLRDGAGWTTVRVGQRRWAGGRERNLLVLPGIGMCVGLVAFTRAGAVAKHVDIADHGAGRLKGRAASAQDVRAFAKAVRKRAARGERVEPHVWHFDHAFWGARVGARYARALERALAARRVPHAPVALHAYPEAERFGTKHRINLVVDPARRTVMAKRSWMREFEHAGFFGRRRGWYPGQRPMRPDELPPDLQPESSEPYKKRYGLM